MSNCYGVGIVKDIRFLRTQSERSLTSEKRNGLQGSKDIEGVKMMERTKAKIHWNAVRENLVTRANQLALE